MKNDYDTRSAQRLPEYAAEMAVEEEPKIIVAARMYEKARRDLHYAQLERQKQDKAIQDARERMALHADQLRSEMEPTAEKAR